MRMHETKRRISNMEFESEAEKLAYPIIENYANENGYAFEYQQSIEETDTKDFVKENEWAEQWTEKNQIDTEYSFEKYRPDFVLENGIHKIIIEIDGKRFHKNKAKDYRRSRRLILEYGFDMIIRIPAQYALNWQLNYKITNMIDRKIKQRDKYWFEWHYYKCENKYGI